MATWYRHADRRHPFTWERVSQPSARWHGEGEGPVQYLADSPDGAWAEFLRHEGITDPADLEGIVRRLWVVTLPDDTVEAAAPAELAEAELRGGLESYAACQAEARRLRSQGVGAIVAPSAALDARGDLRSGPSGLAAAPEVPARTLAVFGSGASWTGWMAHDAGRPHPSLLPRVRPLAGSVSRRPPARPGA